MSLAVHIHTKIKTEKTNMVFYTRCANFRMSLYESEYTCYINMCQIINHYYASVDVLQDCSDA